MHDNIKAEASPDFILIKLFHDIYSFLCNTLIIAQLILYKQKQKSDIFQSDFCFFIYDYLPSSCCSAIVISFFTMLPPTLPQSFEDRFPQ